MSSRGSSQLIRTSIGPSGDSPVRCENEMWPAYATCLFRQNVIDFFFNPSNNTPLAASRILSLRRRLFNFDRPLSPLACATNRLPRFRRSTSKFTLPKIFSTACFTFSKSSVGLTSTSMLISISFSLHHILQNCAHFPSQLRFCPLVHDQVVRRCYNAS